MKKNDLRKKLDEELSLPLWPDTGEILKIGRWKAYDAATKGEIPVIRIGKVLRVSTAWLKRTLQMDKGAA